MLKSTGVSRITAMMVAVMMLLSILPMTMERVSAEDPIMVTKTASYTFTMDSPEGRNGNDGHIFDFEGDNKYDEPNQLGTYTEDGVVVNYRQGSDEHALVERVSIKDVDNVEKVGAKVGGVSGMDGYRMLFRLSNDFYDKVSNGAKREANLISSIEASDVRVDIEYYDGAIGDEAGKLLKNSEIALLYNKLDNGQLINDSWGAGAAPGSDGGRWNGVLNDNRWRTATFNLSSASPLGLIRGSDLLLSYWNNGDYASVYIHKITVSRQVPYVPPAGDMLSVSNVYSDDMIFQAGKPVNIDGTLKAGEEVTVYLGAEGGDVYSGTAIAGDDNKFRVTIPGSENIPASNTEYAMSVSANIGDPIYFGGIVFGDVYYMAGQSNMAYTFNQGGAGDGSPYQDDASLVSYYDSILPDSNIRFFDIDEGKSGTATTPQDNYYENRSWRKLNSNGDVRYISAAASIFAIELRKTVDYPIGFIPAAVGDTNASQWVKDGNCYNGSVYPFKPFHFKGILWYQGESGPVGSDYVTSQRMVINNLRELFRDSDLPFCMTQLANYSGGDFRNVRDRQLEVFKYFEEQAKEAGKQNTVGLISLVDQNLQFHSDIHPDGKKELAERYVAWAKTVIYNQPGLYSGPIAKSAYKNETGDVVVEFDHVGDGLAAKAGGNTINGFKAVTVGPEEATGPSLTRDRLISYTLSEDSPMGSRGINDHTFDFTDDKYDADNQITNYSQNGIVINYRYMKGDYEGGDEYATPRMSQITDATRLTKWGMAPGDVAGIDSNRMMVLVDNQFYNRAANKDKFEAEEYSSMDTVNAVMEIEYYDNDDIRAGDFVIIYASVDKENNTFNHESWSNRIEGSSGDKKWKTARFYLNNAVFMGTARNGHLGDFIITSFGAAPVYIHKITIAKEASDIPPARISSETAVTAELSATDNNKVLIRAANIPTGRILLGLQYAYEKNNVNANLMNSLNSQIGFAAPAVGFVELLQDLWVVKLNTGANGDGTDTTSFSQAKSIIATLTDPDKNTGDLIVAAYAKNGDHYRLLDIGRGAVQQSDYQGLEATITMPYTFPEGTNFVKVFLWDEIETMKTVNPAYSQE